MIEDPWGDAPSTIPPMIPASTARDDDGRRRFRLAAGGVATVRAVGGLAWAQSAHASIGAPTAATTSGSTSGSTSDTSTTTGVGVGGSSGPAQATSAGS